MSDRSNFIVTNSSKHEYKSLKSSDSGREIELTDISSTSSGVIKIGHGNDSSDENGYSGSSNTGMSFENSSGEISE